MCSVDVGRVPFEVRLFSVVVGKDPSEVGLCSVDVGKDPSEATINNETINYYPIITSKPTRLPTAQTCIIISPPSNSTLTPLIFTRYSTASLIPHFIFNKSHLLYLSVGVPTSRCWAS
jgi:hypothetical protein